MFRGKKIQLHSILDPIDYEKGQLIKSLSGRVYAAGTIVFDKYDNTLILVACCDGSWIGCSRVQVEGKRVLDTLDFVNGYRFESGNEVLT